MTVLLVLFFFATFLAIDYFRTRHAFVRPTVQGAPPKDDAGAPRLQPSTLPPAGHGSSGAAARPMGGCSVTRRPSPTTPAPSNSTLTTRGPLSVAEPPTGRWNATTRLSPTLTALWNSILTTDP